MSKPEEVPAKGSASAGAPLVTVAVPSYDGRHLLEVLLPSLSLQRFRDFEVVVVDDASTDGTPLWLREHWPQVEIISLPRRVGVTAALNVCLNAGRGDLLALLNNDMELDPGCLGELVDALHEHPEAGWAGAKMLDYERRDVIDGAGDIYSWVGTGHRRGHGEQDRGQYDEPRAIFGACGGAAMYRRRVLREVGQFDEDFFTFYEDVDWNLRAQLAGFSCRYVPTAVVYHMGSATIGRGLTDFTRYHLWRNALWIIGKDLPASALLRHGGELVRGQQLAFRAARRERKLAIWAKAWRDALFAFPRVVRKRRVIQRMRRIDSRTLDVVVGEQRGAES
jgi:GT2 family glycosyltransferase